MAIFGSTQKKRGNFGDAIEYPGGGGKIGISAQRRRDDPTVEPGCPGSDETARGIFDGEAIGYRKSAAGNRL